MGNMDLLDREHKQAKPKPKFDSRVKAKETQQTVENQLS
jgi:hypothetical protein